MGKRFAVVTLVAVTVALVLLTARPTGAGEMNPEELNMLNLINRERAARSLSILKPDPRMTDLARSHSQEMVDLKYFAHESPVSGTLLERVLGARIDGWIIAGENLAGAPSVEVAHDALMKSEKHKENILNPQYTHLGIGVIEGGPYGRMFSQEFVGYKNVAPVDSTGSIYGRVVDRYGRPLSGAVVRINQTVIPTNRNGEFRFTMVQPGIYTIFYDAAGLFGQTQEGITVNAGETSRPPMVVMSPVSGQVTAGGNINQPSIEVAGRVEKNPPPLRLKIRRRSRRR